MIIDHHHPGAEKSARSNPPHASVAQLVEQLTLNQLVLGSNPSRGTPLNTKGLWRLKPYYQ